MKRLISLLLVLTLLSGCHKPEAPASEPPEAQTETSAAANPAEVPTDPAPSETQPPSTAPVVLLEPADEDLVRVIDYIPGIQQEAAYATENNFTGQPIYDFTDIYLRYGTVKKLARVCVALEAQGLGLKLWDGFRPVSAQFQLWEVCPDPTYVANPTTGYSSHSRGNTVDLTLVYLEGSELEMPTGFDDFSALADRDYSDCPETAAENARLLQSTMTLHGFTGYFGEWWHFSDTKSYPVEKDFQPVAAQQWFADCEEFISLRSRPDTSAQVLTRIPVGGEFQVMALIGDFALVNYNGQQGYVLRSYTAPVSTEENEWVANCQEFISLRETAGGAVMEEIPVGGSMQLLKWEGKYALVNYQGTCGYVLTSYIKPAGDAYFQENLTIVEPTALYSYEQMLEDLEAMQTRWPETVTVDKEFFSEEGRYIPVLRLGNENAEHHILFQGAIHGREHMTAWVLMAMADYALSHDALKPEVCIHILPMVNPDGVTISQTQVLNPVQQAIYELDLTAGYTALDEASYAAQWKANCLGVDINRNFPAGWEEIDDRDRPSSQQYRGSEPFSCAEAYALREYTQAYDFGATISYHAHGSVIYYEYGGQESVNALSEELGQAVGKITGYLLLDSDGVDGAGYKDWAIAELGIPSLTVEIGCGNAPLHQRELYSIFARNKDVISTVAQWVQMP